MAPITRARWQAERGAALVEFALVAPLLLVVIAGIVDFGFLFQRYEVVTNAAREGARLASLPGYVTCPSGGGTATAAGGVDTRVRNYVQQGLSLSTGAMATAMPAGAVVVTCTSMPVAIPGGGTINVQTIRVQVTYTHGFVMLGSVIGLINGTWGNTMNLVARSEMRTEAQSVAGS